MTERVFVPTTQPIVDGQPAFGAACGAAGTVLTSNGEGEQPTFEAPGGGAPGGAQNATQYKSGSGFAGAGPGVAGQVLITIVDGDPPIWGNAHGRLSALIQDVKTSGTAGGTANAASFNQRDLNTIAFDETGGLVTVGSNQFVLGIGTWDIFARAPAFKCDSHRLRLVNVTDTTNVTGPSNWTSSATNTSQIDATVRALVTLAAPKTFRLDHYFESNAGAGNAQGIASNLVGVPEIYAEVYLQQVL